jgi:rare lipoprotein A
MGEVSRRSKALVILVVLASGGCAPILERDGPGTRGTPSEIADAVPKSEPRSKYGNAESYVVLGQRYYTLKTASGFTERGIASWYGKKFHGRKTSSGEIYDMYKMTAAHKGLPLPTYVQIKNLDNNRTAIVKVNDRGPFHANRVIDLSYAAALKLDVVDKGTAFVEIRALDAAGKPSGPLLAEKGVGAGFKTGVYLQIGAFRDRGNARSLADKLGKIVSRGVHIREVDSGGTVLHRVQIGPVLSVEAADTIVTVLARIGISDHHFVTNQVR